jgi:putative transposase
VGKPYHITSKDDTQGLASFLAKNGQALLPMMELIEQSQVAVDELIDVVRRATIEAVLRLSAERMAGPPHPGKKGGAIGWHGREQGTVCLKERKLRVKRPRLRKKGTKKGGEVPVPAYEAMQADGKLGSRMLEILLRGVSTRQYAKVLPQMAETVGVSRSSVSREAVEASEAELRKLCERRWDQIELLVIYVDGVRFGDHQVLGPMGVDREGRKHVLGLAEGASENEVVARGLLEDLVRRGVKPDRRSTSNDLRDTFRHPVVYRQSSECMTMAFSGVNAPRKAISEKKPSTPAIRNVMPTKRNRGSLLRGH